MILKSKIYYVNFLDYSNQLCINKGLKSIFGGGSAAEGGESASAPESAPKTLTIVIIHEVTRYG